MPQKPQDVIHNRIMQEIAETVPQHPGVHIPKRDKILEWTLYGIYQQLQEIGCAVRSIDVHYRLKQ